MRRYSKKVELSRQVARLAKLAGQTIERPPRTEVAHPRVHRLDVRLSIEERVTVVEAYDAGLSAEDVAELFNPSKGSVLQLLHEDGASLRRQSLTGLQVAECVRLYLSGLTIRETALELGVPKTTVQDALARAGVAKRKAARRGRAES